MDPYLAENQSTIKGPLQNLEVTPPTPDGNYALEENIPPAGHHQETNRSIGTLSQKQFNQMSQESQTSSIIYQKGSLGDRISPMQKEKVKKITNYIDVLVSNTDMWRKWSHNEYLQSQIQEKHDRQIEKSKQYWAIIKDNFADLLKRLHQMSRHST